MKFKGLEGYNVGALRTHMFPHVSTSFRSAKASTKRLELVFPAEKHDLYSSANREVSYIFRLGGFPCRANTLPGRILLTADLIVKGSTQYQVRVAPRSPRPIHEG